MKILSLTINSINYGNRLQSYAVCHLLKKISNETDSFILQDYSVKNNLVKALIKNLIPTSILKWNIERKHKKENSVNLEKERNFKNFTSLFIDNQELIFRSKKDIEKYMKQNPYDYVFVGSDQVWNPDFAGQDYFFLDFVEPQKRIAFSASIGYEELSPEVLARYTPYWKQMRYISVREDSAADIIEKATGKRPDVFLDPTLLLTQKEWNEIIEKPKCWIPDKYILCLFLGNMPEEIKTKYEQAYNMELVILNDKSFSDYYVQGPSEFVWLIQNAELVLTDSFHCSVFSIIYHKQFWVFERDDVKLKNMFTRLETLLKRFEMMDRIQKWNAEISFEQIKEERFVQAEQIRIKERKRVLKIFNNIVKEDTHK